MSKSRSSSKDVLGQLENFFAGEQGENYEEYQHVFTHGILHDFSPVFFERLKCGYQVISQEMKEKS